MGSQRPKGEETQIDADSVDCLMNICFGWFYLAFFIMTFLSLAYGDPLTYPVIEYLNLAWVFDTIYPQVFCNSLLATFIFHLFIGCLPCCRPEDFKKKLLHKGVIHVEIDKATYDQIKAGE